MPEAHAEIMDIEDAVERAITECMQEGILSEFLRENRAEAKKVSIYEYDEEKHMRQTRAEGFDEGELSGSLKMCRELSIPREIAMKKIMELYSLSPENARKMMEKYWSDN